MPSLTLPDGRQAQKDFWRERLRSHDLSQGARLVKSSALGGDGNDTGFEQSFSSLAHSFLRDKAPSLLDHELGFQLLDRSEDNTKACGIVAFKVGSQLLYAPVFFLQGDLKGHELLYVKNSDLFLPLSEKWLNYILNRKPNLIGERVDRNSASFGVRQPDLSRLQSRGKFAGFAGSLPAVFQEALPGLAAAALTSVAEEQAAWARELNLPRFCKESASLSQLSLLADACRSYPAMAAEMVRHHGSLDFLHEAVPLAAAREKRSSVLAAPRRERLTGSVLADRPWLHPLKSGALKVITYDAAQVTELPEGTDEEDAERLMQDGVLFQDNRPDEEIATPVAIQVEQKLFNPTETGLYMVLSKPGEFEKCFIAMMPHGPKGRESFATVVRLDEGGRDWINCRASQLWCCSRIEGEEEQSWHDSLPDPSSLDVSDRKRVMLVGPARRSGATLPFSVRRSLGSAKGGASYEVSFSDWCNGPYPGGSPQLVRPSWSSEYDSYSDGERIHLDAKDGTTIRSCMGDVWIPQGYKLLRLEPAERDTEESGDSCCGSSSQSETPPFRPGNLIDAQLSVMKKTSELRIHADGSRATVNGRALRPREALIHLVADYGLREKTARLLLDEAKRQGSRGRAFSCRLKQAAPAGDPYLTGQGPTSPGFPEPSMTGGGEMGFAGQVQQPLEQSIPIPGMEGGIGREAYEGQPQAPMDMAPIDQAMQTGQKEVFDTSVIGGMLKSVRDDTMVDRYIPDLVKALDRVGRLLFNFLWHGDKFADRYGKADMNELEDSLRNTFENLGDLVLFLRERSSQPYPDEDATGMGLEGIS